MCICECLCQCVSVGVNVCVCTYLCEHGENTGGLIPVINMVWGTGVANGREWKKREKQVKTVKTRKNS